MRSKLLKLIAASLLLSPLLALAAVPSTLGFSARIADNGRPVTGTHQFVFKLWTVATGGTEGTDDPWIEPATGTASLAVADGVVTATLGDVANGGVALTPFNGTPLWLEVTMDGQPFAPRIAIQSVPYALRAAAADTADSMNVPLSCTDVTADYTLNPGGGGCPSQRLCCTIFFCFPCDFTCRSPACPAGFALTGGGFNSSNVRVDASLPNGAFWDVRAFNNDGVNAVNLTTYAHCCKVP